MIKLKPFPYDLMAKFSPFNVSNRDTLTREDIDKFLSEIIKYRDSAQAIEYQYVTLYEENRRLRHENEFMLKLVQEKLE